MSLEDADILELQDRYCWLIKQYANLAMELVPKLEKFGKYKKELQLISVEFVSRGVDPEEPDSLKELVETEINKRKNNKE